MESSSSQPGMTLVPRGCLTMSGDITDFHNGGREEGASGILCVEGRSAAKHPTVLSTAPHRRMIRARVSVCQVEAPWHRAL